MVKIIFPGRVSENAELVAVPRIEYERLKKIDWETKDTKGKIRRGLRAFREGKTIVADTIDEALRRAREIRAGD